MYLANYLGILHQSERDLADAFRKVGEGYVAEADIYHACNTLAKQCEEHAVKLGPFVDRYGEKRDEEPERLYHELFDEIRGGSLGLRDGELLRHRVDHDRPGRPGHRGQGVARGRERLRGRDLDPDKVA
jgi:hypothetical protein